MFNSIVVYAAGMATIDSVMMTLIKLKHISYLSGSYILPLSMAIYSVQPLLFSKGMEFQGIGIINALWNAVSSIIIALIGCLVFSEKIELVNWIGIALCSVGIILITW